MIGVKQNAKRSTSLLQQSARSFAFGAKPKPISQDHTDYDIVLVGGLNATAMTKFMQFNPECAGMKIACISTAYKFLKPQCYFGCSHAHMDPSKVEAVNMPG